jgi:Mg2+/citrate symporter
MNRHRFDHLQPTGKLLRSHSDEKKKNTTTTDRLIQEEASKFCEKSKWFTFNIVVKLLLMRWMDNRTESVFL